ncbi:MAG: DUF799 family lipoprotein [Bacteroidales bacterium]|nr:DUF799 family lipoprotein [Bacteroidales bacterium]
MKNTIIILGLFVVFLSSCTTTSTVTKSVAYKGIFDEKPLTILIMPPINRSTNVEAKEYFHSTLYVPVSNCGFYVIPPFLSMEILKKESAYDAELFLDAPLQKFGEVFGADLALFTIIHKWDKSGILAKVYVEVEYIVKSTKTNEVVYTRHGNITYNASVSTGAPGIVGLIANVAISAINTAATNYMDVARVCNSFTFKDFPAGKYSPMYNLDGNDLAGMKVFNVYLNNQYR